MVMNENTTKAPERRRPVTLTRRNTSALRTALTRVLPDDKPRLDIAAFNSSI